MLFSKFRSGFFKNIFASLTGSTIAQLLPVITAPILARIYLPHDYGVFGIFLSIAVVFSIFTNLQFSSGIIVAKTEEDTAELVNISLVLSVFTSAFFQIILLLFGNNIATLLGADEVKNILLLCPFVIFLQSYNSIASAVSVRYKLFTSIAYNRVFTAMITAAVSITLGILTKSFTGLIAGYIVGQLYNAIHFSIAIKQSVNYSIFHINFDKSAFLSAFKKHIQYPRYFLATEFINNGINQLPVFLLGALSSTSSVGHYNMSLRILGMPISFVSSSVSDVFRQRATEDYQTKGTCRPIFMKTLGALSLLAIVPFVVIVFFGSDIFAWALGEQWRSAGTYTQALGLMYFFRFIVGPLSYIYIVAGNLKGDLLNHIYFFISSLAILYFLIPIDIWTAFLVYSINYSLIYLVVLYRSYHLSINHAYRPAII